MGVALGSQSVAYRLPTKWLWGGFEMALGSQVYAESMPSLCLVYAFKMALGGFALAYVFPAFDYRPSVLGSCKLFIFCVSGVFRGLTCRFWA